MRLDLTGRHVDITAGIRRVVAGKLAKLERRLNDSAVSAQVVLSQEKNGTRADITLHARGEKFMHGIGRGDDVTASVGAAIEKLVQQAERVKGKWQERKRRLPRTVDGSGLGAAVTEEPAPTAAGRPRAARARMPRILKASRQVIETMSISDAAARTGGGTGPVIFRDAQTARIAVLYRAPGGELTLIDTET